MNRKYIIPISILAVAGFIVYRVFLGSNGMINQYFIYKDNGELREKIDSLTKVITLKELEIRRLKTDTAYIEFIARTQFGMSREGEKVIKFIDEKKEK